MPPTRWSQPNGYRAVLKIGLPLVVSMASTTIMMFTDRLFLAGYSLEAIAAALPAGIAVFLATCFFHGLAAYVNVFVAQYTGAGQPQRVGAALWQGVYCCLGAWLILASLYFIAGPLFAWAGHQAAVQRLEVTYFQILILFAGLPVLAVELSCFFSGRGLTAPVMIVNCLAAGVNIPLDYALINGAWGFPEWGIKGAAIATVISAVIAVILFAIWIFTPAHIHRYGLWQGRRFDRELFGRLLRFGGPGGAQFFIDIFGITYFVFMVGRLGKLELAASNMVLSINTLAFLPMIGFQVAVQTLVGQAMGRRDPSQAHEAAISTLHITLFYMTAAAACFVLFPHWLMELFHPRELSAAEYAPIVELGRDLLIFVAIYCLVDAVAIIYSGALKGAGDTSYVMWAQAVLTIMLLVLPCQILVGHLGMGIFTAWLSFTLYIAVLGLVFWLRFKDGRWQSIRVI